MSIARNTAHYSLALVYQKILGFVYFALLARGLGVEDTGQYVFALSFTTLFSVLADIGFAPVLIREVAKDKTKTQNLFSQVFSVKIFISVITHGLVVFFVNILGYPTLTKTLVYIAGGVMVLDSFSLMHWAVFRGHQTLKYESIGVVGFQTITVALGLAALRLGLGLIPLLLATLFGSLFFFSYSLFNLLTKLKLKLRLVYDKAVIKWFVITALPFALAGVFAKVYTQIDTVMLSKIGCPDAAICEARVGWYGLASKITLAWQFIPIALSAALFPAFAESYKHEPSKVKKTYEDGWRYLALVVVPVAAIMIAIAPELIVTIWGTEFLPAALPLQILMGSLVFLFLTFPNGAFLNAAGKQLINTGFMGAAVVVNVILNIILIMKLQMTGAAIASVSSTALLFTLGLVKSWQMVRFRLGHLLWRFVRIALSGVIVYFVLITFKAYLHILSAIGLGAIVYLVALLVLGAPGWEDIKLAQRLLGKRE